MTEIAEWIDSHPWSTGELPEGQWYEARLDYGVQPADLYWKVPEDLVDGIELYHHFVNEPWWPDRSVVRLLVVDTEDEVVSWLESVASEVEPWKREEDDQDLYGFYFPFAMRFFHASSVLSFAGGEVPDQAKESWDDYHQWLAAKLSHCVNNEFNLPDNYFPPWLRKVLAPIFRYYLAKARRKPAGS